MINILVPALADIYEQVIYTVESLDAELHLNVLRKLLAQCSLTQNYLLVVYIQFHFLLFTFEGTSFHQSTLLWIPSTGEGVALRLVPSGLFSKLL